MKFDLDTFSEILITITRNRTRSLLTAFGVFWGIFMLITLLGNAKGFKASLEREFNGFAQNSAFLYAQPTEEAYKGYGSGRSWNMELSDMERIRRIEGVELVTGILTEYNKNASHGNMRADNCAVKGVYPEYTSIETPVVRYGRFVNDIDILEQRKVCFLGNEIYKQLFSEQTDPCGERILLDGTYYQVIGVADPGNDNINISGDADYTVCLPFTTFASVFHTGTDVHLICLTAKPGYRMSSLEPKIAPIVKRNHQIHPDDERALEFFSAEALFQVVDNLFSGIDLLFILIGFGTFISGVIGVSNIMMVTVRERTVEIGIRRAIGATPRVIMQQILCESLVLTLVAGVMGICVSVGVLQLMSLAMDVGNKPGAFMIDFWLAVGATVLIALFGVLAGIAPALRAMAIKPVDAMRDE